MLAHRPQVSQAVADGMEGGGVHQDLQGEAIRRTHAMLRMLCYWAIVLGCKVGGGLNCESIN